MYENWKICILTDKGLNTLKNQQEKDHKNYIDILIATNQNVHDFRIYRTAIFKLLVMKMIIPNQRLGTISSVISKICEILQSVKSVILTAISTT
ncbi:hypothetical protein CUN59_12105 [Cuspidothrix issatschenkoi CHARLIE-1]|uniref:Uncharacterized protein n=1 Tax=Cuspidothrix issatschenkoi CHARLIE-1 TaxID=2052836 RepID=A0A2S6CTJ1_9CYAN|nr:hypothetical protein CUN59_12105 [Cuspidothrix issatschenkoi CHARLIE-1]